LDAAKTAETGQNAHILIVVDIFDSPILNGNYGVFVRVAAGRGFRLDRLRNRVVKLMRERRAGN